MADQKEVNPSDNLTLQRATKLFIASFEHSQGDGFLQPSLFRYIKSKHIDWHISDEFRKEIEQKVTAPINNIVKPAPARLLADPVPPGERKHPFATKSSVRQSIQSELVEMQDAFESRREKSLLSKKLLVQDIALSMATQETKILITGGGRTFGNDPNFSYLYYYAIEGNKTGIQEFDELYEEIGKFIKDGSNFIVFNDDPLELRRNKNFTTPEDRQAYSKWLREKDLSNQDQINFTSATQSHFKKMIEELASKYKATH